MDLWHHCDVYHWPVLKTDETERIVKDLAPGSSARFRPNLDLRGEGSVYMRFTNAGKQTRETVVCGYTEYFSGSSVITISNEDFVVEEDCW